MKNLLMFMCQHQAPDTIARGLDGAIASGAVLVAGLVHQVHAGADIEEMFDALDASGITADLTRAEQLREQLYAVIETDMPKREPKAKDAPQIDVVALQAQMAAMAELLKQAMAQKAGR